MFLVASYFLINYARAWRIARESIRREGCSFWRLLRVVKRIHCVLSMRDHRSLHQWNPSLVELFWLSTEDAKNLKIFSDSAIYVQDVKNYAMVHIGVSAHLDRWRCVKKMCRKIDLHLGIQDPFFFYFNVFYSLGT